MSYLWDQLALFEPQWTNSRDGELYRGQLSLIQFLEASSDDFEHVCASMLHRKPYPTLEAALIEIILEKTRKSISQLTSSSLFDFVVIVTAAPSKFSSQQKNSASAQKSRMFCWYCEKSGHNIDNCFKVGTTQKLGLFCGYCNKPGHHIDNSFKVGTSKELQCNYCKLFGHTIDKCLK